MLYLVCLLYFLSELIYLAFINNCPNPPLTQFLDNLSQITVQNPPQTQFLDKMQVEAQGPTDENRQKVKKKRRKKHSGT